MKKLNIDGWSEHHQDEAEKEIARIERMLAALRLAIQRLRPASTPKHRGKKPARDPEPIEALGGS